MFEFAEGRTLDLFQQIGRSRWVIALLRDWSFLGNYITCRVKRTLSFFCSPVATACFGTAGCFGIGGGI